VGKSVSVAGRHRTPRIRTVSSPVVVSFTLGAVGTRWGALNDVDARSVVTTPRRLDRVPLLSSSVCRVACAATAACERRATKNPAPPAHVLESRRRSTTRDDGDANAQRAAATVVSAMCSWLLEQSRAQSWRLTQWAPATMPPCAGRGSFSRCWANVSGAELCVILVGETTEQPVRPICGQRQPGRSSDARPKELLDAH